MPWRKRVRPKTEGDNVQEVNIWRTGSRRRKTRGRAGAGAFPIGASPRLPGRQGGQPGFEIGHSINQIFLFGSGLGGHCFDSFEFVAANEIHAREHPFELIAQPRFYLGLDPRQGAQSTRGDAREIIEKPVLALHPEASIGCPDRMPEYGTALSHRVSEGKSFTPDQPNLFAPVLSGSYRRGRLNAGMTSSASHWNCSSMIASGVPIGLLRLMCCMPG